MKLWKLAGIALGVSLLWTSATSSLAGPATVPPGKPMRPIAGQMLVPIRAALAQLNLTPDQQTRIRGFMAQAETSLRTIRENTSTPPEQRRKAVETVLTTLRANIASVLTTEQKERLQQILAERADRFREGLKALNLTAQQKVQITRIWEQFRTRTEAIRNDSTLTPEQKRERLQALRRETEARILRLLTPEQREQLRRWLATHRPFAPEKA